MCTWSNCRRSSSYRGFKERVIEGAALDVFEFEPSIGEELKKLKNVVLTPHIGNATFETRDAMAVMAAKNIIKVLNNEDLH